MVYSFTESDIRDALEKMAKITYHPNKRLEFDWSEEDGKLTAEIMVVFEYKDNERQQQPCVN